MRKLFREINPGENKEDYLDYIKSVCRIDNGRRVCGSHKNRIYFARLKWNLYHSEDPIVKDDGCDIDHDNDNPMNDDISNLIKRTHGNHTSRHKNGKKYNLGNKNSVKPVMADGIGYSSGVEAAKVLGISSSSITSRIKQKRPGYFYIGDKQCH